MSAVCLLEHVKRLVKHSFESNGEPCIKSLSNERHSNRLDKLSAEKSRERAEKWKKENPDLYREQRKRHRMKHVSAYYEKLENWRKENPDLSP